ncbi:putative bifunctional diguanylate cyclase/phosphodiesterase [Methylocapsa palsarum]|nr:EAL domain-containing protein [Methylocapsa palsarum]
MMEEATNGALASSIRRRITIGFLVLLILLVALAGVAVWLIEPVEVGATLVREDTERAEAATAVSLQVSDAHAFMAQYALSASAADQKAAQGGVTGLDAAIERMTRGRSDDGGLVELARRYRGGADSTFAAVELRRASIERMQSAGAEIHSITSAIEDALQRETDAEKIRRGMRLGATFHEADRAALRFLASRSPEDLDVARGALATLPKGADELGVLLRENHRIKQLLTTLAKPLSVYDQSLQSVIRADDDLRRLSTELNAASESALGAAAVEHARALKSEQTAVASMLDRVRSVRGLLIGASLSAVAIGLVLAILSGRAVMTQFRKLEAVQDALQKKSTMLETTLANMDQGLIMTTPERTVGVVNESAKRLLDLPSSLVREGAPFDDVIEYQRKHLERAETGENIRAVPRGDARLDHPHSCELRSPNGTVLEMRSVPLQGGGVVQTYTDITERSQAEEKIIYAAHHDVLTCLPNRALFEERLGDAIAKATRTGSHIAVLFLDLDRFKLVNDTLGHSAGDELLKIVANRMRQEMRASDTLARVGGDEFAVVIPDLSSLEAAVNTAERLRGAVRNPYLLSQGKAIIGVSIGIACYPIHAGAPDQLLDLADLALYRAKAIGRDACCVYDEVLDVKNQDEMILESSLQFALQERQFEIAYQPIWEVRAQRIVGVEALVRWRHPVKGLIYPDSFIPLAERTGLIVELGQWVMETACREVAAWPAPIALSVNIAPPQLRRGEIVQELRDLLVNTQLPASRLKLEIAESQLSEDTPGMSATLSSLRDLGVGLTLDGFGTGSSSLVTLRSFPFADIKIDRRLTKEIAQDLRSRSLFEAILHVCRILKMDCIAEGVETKEQFALLQSFGCAYAQGFLIGKPEPAAAMRETLCRIAAGERPMAPVAPV